MNKVFEVIEAKNIFNILYKNIEVLIHRDFIFMQYCIFIMA